ncbi:RNA-binding riboflavin kinase RibR [Peribacillus sp. Bi96]|uniref:hypothetical protein n=1 Tax=unclassified Peribacillus TaxID=2675266 RepID=UPI001D94A401|nr:hypothetical protein [Peribacillus sp. Bi96]CAH0255839.1 RNA-binding riboflavin kinase RibR [Peribacillus sp. Bi96]
MQKEALRSISPMKERQNGRLEYMEHLNLPDRIFFHWCQQQYGLNRGVYNTIDHWFYEYGIVHILYRRINLLAFLEFASKPEPESGKTTLIKFGSGGLTQKLQEFIAH